MQLGSEKDYKSKLTFDTAERTWFLKDASPELWAQFEKEDPAAFSVFNNLDLSQQVPISTNLDHYVSDESIRPKRSRRAFYLRTHSAGVLTVKGSEIRNNHLGKELDRGIRPGMRPWTLVENFLFFEQKLPYAVSLDEALSESLVSMEFQLEHFRKFGKLEMAPLPLVVHRWSEEATSNYFKMLQPHLRKRSRSLANALFKERGLGTYIYYYPHIPYRIAFLTPKSAESYEGRLKTMMNPELSDVAFDAPAALENLLGITARMLGIGFFPLSFEDYGVGQCIASQNVTMKGGITDMDSLMSFDQVKSDKEFYSLFLSTLVILCSTARAALVCPLPIIEYEFTDPSIISTLISSYVWDGLKRNYAKIKNQINADPRLDFLLGEGSMQEIHKILQKIYPTEVELKPSLHDTCRLEKGGKRHFDI